MATYVRLLGRLARVDVLLIDDWGLAPVTDQQRQDLLEILEDRDGGRSTIITRRPSATTTSPVQRSPTPSATASFTTRIESY